MWDFSIRQRAEDRWQEAHAAAAEQRLLKQLDQHTDRPAPLFARLWQRVALGGLRGEIRPAPAIIAIAARTSVVPGQHGQRR